MALGVRVAMPIAQAGEMTRDGEPPRQERHDPWLDHQSLCQVASLFQRDISPLVAIEMLDDQPWADHPRHQPESLFCDITGIAHLFDGEEGLLRAAETLLSQRNLVARIAIADSVGAAWAIAHYASQHTANTKSGWIAPSGAGQEPILPLPVEALRIAPQTVSTLRRLGVERIDQLLSLPKNGLATRLGKPLVRRIEQAIGEIDEPLTVHRQLADDTYTLDLEYPTDDQKILVNRIEGLIEKARAGLATRNRGALRLTCRLDLAVHPPLTLEIGLFAPTLEVDHLTGLMTHQIESKRLPSSVVRLTLSVKLTGPLCSSQTSLFENDSCDADAASMSGSAISRLVDSLSGRLGRDAVIGVTLDDDPLPENAYSCWPLAGNGRALGRSKSTPRSRTAKSSLVSSPRPGSAPENSRPPFNRTRSNHDPSPEHAMRRPLSLLVRPLPLVVDPNASYCVPDQRLPDRFRLDGIVHQVIRYWGPERIETGWWKGPSVRRDYYRIETDRGLWWWIFRSLVREPRASDTQTSRHWMLHGRFT